MKIKLTRLFLRPNKKNTFTGGNNAVTGSIGSQTINFGSTTLKKTSQINSLPCRTTTIDGELASTQSVKEKPVGGIIVTVNGMVIPVSDGDKTPACYFSSDNGLTAKFINQTEAGDKLYWNGSIVGWQLSDTDNLRIDYLIA